MGSDILSYDTHFQRANHMLGTRQGAGASGAKDSGLALKEETDD